MSNAAYYNRFTTRVEVARQAGVCYYTPALLEAKATQLKVGDYNALADDQQMRIREQVKQEYLAYLFLHNSSAKLHTQLKKDVANDYSKGNIDAYPTDIRKALTLMNEDKPLKLDGPAVTAQGTAFATKGKQGQKKGGDKSPKHNDYIKALDWNKMTPEAKTKIIEARKKQSKASDDDDKSVASVKSLTKTVTSLEKSNRKLKKLVSALQKCEEDDDTDSSLSSEGTNHFQKGVEMLQKCNPKIVLALKTKKSNDLDLRNVLLLDNQSTFDLCCNKRFTSKIFGTRNPLIMTSNGGGSEDPRAMLGAALEKSLRKKIQNHFFSV
jgi:hypothetical protein